MKKIILTTVLALISLNFSANAEDYTFGSIGYTKHTAGDPHDTEGTTFYSDPEENGFVLSYGHGTKSDGIGSDFELTYYSEVSQKVNSGTTLDVSTLALMSNAYLMPDVAGSSLMIGGGIGLAYTLVDTSYSASGVTFNGDETQLKFGYQFLIGYSLDNMQLIYKISDFGEVEGGSGTGSNGATYVPDEFDNKYQSINVRFLF